MNISDPISDLLTRIRNAQKAGHDVISVPASKMKIAITHLLKQEGFVKNYKCVKDNKQGVLKIALNYTQEGRGVIQGIDRVSRPSHRIYVNKDKVPFVRNGYGVAILSTSRGVMTDRTARQAGLGGELMCTVF